ncbi:disulfide bond formation protein B [Virgibacillus profundi]|uniref:Probable disulfide formation protein n=1 Tax=Virgibacillus profundi TaxID=2024555 RepID=A0A2A2ICI0_9BACI|nr:disulfide oxidoreductase [Virgibacillus profundi]PAV29282.1 disulfide bond formation protein B [Virgibacillus profundi]PXY53451.1 disulfide bond formation protein B [Virgibacillus profundi]
MGKLTKKAENLLMLIWAQSFIALAGSLFYSEVMGYVPCELCWYQRILMYPLVIIYGMAAIKKEISIALPGLILSGIGMVVSTYHYLVQKLPALQEAGGSCGLVPCNFQYVNYFGFITIPFLAGTAFIIIFVLHLMLLKESRRK